MSAHSFPNASSYPLKMGPLKKNYIYLFIFGCSGSSYGLYGLSLAAVSRGYSLVAEHRPPIAVASLVAEHRLQPHGLQ